MDRYFAKFPTVRYNGVNVTDISKSARFTDLARKSATLFYPAEIEAGLRADQFADAYYNDTEMDWLIWLTNNIVDPYYEWYLSEFEFDAFIAEKYGSYEEAVEEIVFYRNNWTKLEESITPSEYDSQIAPVLKKYYTPQYAENHKVLRYIRRAEDLTVATNRIMQFELEPNKPFYLNEIVYIKDDTEVVIGQGTVITANQTSVFLQHISGNTTANSTVTRTLEGRTSGAWTTSSLSTVISISIDDLEASYWDAVTAYDIENEKNEARKDLLIVDAKYAGGISEQLRLKLKL